MITRDDLNWWLELSPTLDWTFAKTYAKTAPHDYVVSGRTAGMTPGDFVRAGRVIRTFGQPAKFYSYTNVYLTSSDGWKWWGMDHDVAATSLINRAPAEHVYGSQNAPRTMSGIESPYNALASEWDALYGMTAEEGAAVVELVRSLVGERPPQVLDVGCGTGLVLDLELTTADRYVGIDPSQAMLNELVLKHPHLAGLHAMRFDDAIERRVLGGTRFGIVTALGGAASYLAPTDIHRLPLLTHGPIVLMHHAEAERTIASDLQSSEIAASREAARALAADSGGTQLRVGRFVVTVVTASVSKH